MAGCPPLLAILVRGGCRELRAGRKLHRVQFVFGHMQQAQNITRGAVRVRQYLRRALQDYRSGARKHVPMSSLANSLQPVDIDALADWYAAQPGFAPGASR